MRRSFMALRRTARAASRDLADLGQRVHDLQQGLAQLAAYVAANARQASSAVPERLSAAVPDGLTDRLDGLTDRLSDLSHRVGTTLRHNARSVGSEAARVSTGALNRLEDEMINRPLLVIAVAAGIGFLLGALNRRISD